MSEVGEILLRLELIENKGNGAEDIINRRPKKQAKTGGRSVVKRRYVYMQHGSAFKKRYQMSWRNLMP